MTVTRSLQVIDDHPESVLKVAFATSDREFVDQHFGSAKAFAIYGINPDDTWLQQVAEFGELDEDGNEDKLKEKLVLLQDCVAVYCRACGASAVRQLIEMGVQPVKIHEGARIDELLESLQKEILLGPSGWLAKAMRSKTLNAPSRFDDMEAEGWNE